MKISWLAAIIESTYYNGRVQSDDKKMDIDDFTQYVRIANGSVMRDTYYDELRKGGNPYSYFAGAIVTEYFDISRKGRFRVIEFDPDASVVRLPHGCGIIRVSPLMASPDDESEDCPEAADAVDESFDTDWIKGEPGMESTYGSSDLLDDLGEAFFVPIGNTCRLFGNDKAQVAEVDYIRNDEEMDIPEDACWKIANIVLGPVLKVAGWPVDTTDNSNPNVTTFKSRLDAPVGIQS